MASSPSSTGKCTKCGGLFAISAEEAELRASIRPAGLSNFEIPAPSFCPECRRRRRLSFRNERTLYWRKSDASGQQIISAHSPDKPYPVYQAPEWWADNWDPFSFGRAVALERSFFEQFDALRRVVPTMGVTIVNCENCTYNNDLINSKNCYFVFGSANCEDAAYCTASIGVKDSVDIWWSKALECCAYAACCADCANCLYCDRCSGCDSLIFCRDCLHCSHCFGCANLHQKQYHIFNVPYSKEQYFSTLETFNRGSFRQISRLKAQVEDFYKSMPYRAPIEELSEGCSGDMIYTSSNCSDCFTISASENCRHLFESGRNKNCQDLDFCYDNDAGLCESINSTFCSNSAFLAHSYGCSNSFYLYECQHCDNCFGCAGLRRAKYCILNRQYSKDDYLQLVSQLTPKMRSGGEWGEFFPSGMSPFGYNETDAQYIYPLMQEQAERDGFRWSAYERPAPRVAHVLEANSLPDHIGDVEDSIVEAGIRCEESGRLFRLTGKELELHRKLTIPLPRLHPDERYSQMLLKRGRLKLTARSCEKCGKPLQSLFSEAEVPIAWCGSCYDAEYR